MFKMSNEKWMEQCIKCVSGYEANEEKCQACTLENYLKFYFYEGKEKCKKCEDGYSVNKEKKCLNCSFIHQKCQSWGFDYYGNGKHICLRLESVYKLNNY